MCPAWVLRQLWLFLIYYNEETEIFPENTIAGATERPRYCRLYTFYQTIAETIVSPQL